MFDTPHPLLTDDIAEHAALYCLGDFPPEDRKNYEEHLSSCAVCRSEVEKCSAVLADLASAGSGSLPAKARANFLGRIRDEKASREQWSKLSTVLITSQISTRPSRKKDPSQVSAKLDKLSANRSAGVQELLDASVRVALDLCDPGSAGLSVLYEQEQVFRWDAVAGKLSAAKGGTTPSTWSPCGTTLDFGAAQLFERPSRCFEYFNSSAYPIVEGLVVPVYVGEKPLGTL